MPNTQAKDIKNITIGLSVVTRGKVAECVALRKKLHNKDKSKAGIVAEGIHLLHEILTEMEKGGVVYIEHPKSKTRTKIDFG